MAFFKIMPGGYFWTVHRVQEGPLIGQTFAMMAKHGRRQMSWLTFLELCWAMLGQVGPTLSPMSPQVGQHDPKNTPREAPNGHKMPPKGHPNDPTKHKQHNTHNSAFGVSMVVKQRHAYNALSTSSTNIGPTDFFNLLGAKYTTHTTRPGGMREAIK